MSADTRAHRLSKLSAAAVAMIGLCVLATPLTPATAQVPYLGIDLGNGVGIGIGAPPSAYGMAPASPLAPFYPAPGPYYYRY
jgi:hypothetical protein